LISIFSTSFTLQKKLKMASLPLSGGLRGDDTGGGTKKSPHTSARAFLIYNLNLLSRKEKFDSVPDEKL
jgi:hypothetical protein